MENEFKNQIFHRGVELPKAIADHFTGKAYFNQLVEGGNDWNCPVSYVTFQPGCRNFWHRHPGGQILLVTEGNGWYQEWGQEARYLNPGDVVMIPSGAKHWHGASKDSWFAHIYIETNSDRGSVEWLDEVSEEQYSVL